MKDFFTALAGAVVGATVAWLACSNNDDEVVVVDVD